MYGYNIAQFGEGESLHECPDGQCFKLGLDLFSSEQRDQEHGRKENADIPARPGLLIPRALRSRFK